MRNLAGIIAGNDTMALGAAAAVKGAGLHGVKIVGFDGSPDAVAAIRAGEMQATALQPAVVIARMAVDEADRLSEDGNDGQGGDAGDSVRPGDEGECGGVM